MRNLRARCFREFQIVLVLVAGKGVCQRYIAGILIYMTMKSMILFTINCHKLEVKHEIARARLLCVATPRFWTGGYGGQGVMGVAGESRNNIISYHLKEVCSKVVTFEEQ